MRIAASFCLATLAANAHAGEGRAKLPEPVVAESITDIDASESGELEGDLVGAAAATGSWAASVEAEWRATERLGVAAEGGLAREGATSSSDLLVGLSWLLAADRAREMYLQVEASGALEPPRSDLAPIALGDPTLPYAFGLRWAARRGWWTLRAGLGTEFGGTPRPRGAPLRSSVALLGQLGPLVPGIELLADGERAPALRLAPTVLWDASSVHVPVHVGAAVLWAPRTPTAALLRLVVEFD
jgi:hypothetical protein